MQKIKYYLEKYKSILILTILLIILLLAVLYTVIRPDKKVEQEETKEIVLTEKINIKEEQKEEKIKVDIKGFVEKPGVYEMSNSDRVIDVIEKSGGLKTEANTSYLNLSKKLVDQMIIIIYSNEEINKFIKEEKEIIYIEYECKCPDNINDSCINKEDIVNTNGTKEEKENNENKKISINTATLEELMTLSGIGESKAKEIIKYREENGEFKNIEDIMKVSGIGESAYSKIKDNIEL